MKSGISAVASAAIALMIALAKASAAQLSPEGARRWQGLCRLRLDRSGGQEAADDDLRFNKIDKKAQEKSGDKLGDLRQQGEDAFMRCFSRRAPQQPSFAEATRQAQALLKAAMSR